MMQTFLAAVVVFLLAFLGLALGKFRGQNCLNCSCKAAKRLMNRSDESACGNPLLDLPDADNVSCGVDEPHCH